MTTAQSTDSSRPVGWDDVTLSTKETIAYAHEFSGLFEVSEVDSSLLLLGLLMVHRGRSEPVLLLKQMGLDEHALGNAIGDMLILRPDVKSRRVAFDPFIYMERPRGLDLPGLPPLSAECHGVIAAAKV